MTQIPLFLPEGFVRTIHNTFGERGREWLQRLSTLLADCAQRWALMILPPFPNLSFNYVTPVVRADGTPAVLKLGVPHKELWTEIAALQVYGGRGSVRLLDADREQGVLLLERLDPGTPLTTLADEDHDEQATSIAARVMRGLWRPMPPEHDFPTTRDWAQGMERLRHRFGGGTGPFPIALVEEAETLFVELLASQEELVLLHGDLHHDNILSAQREGWLAIDPKGLVGEPAYEVGAMLRNLWLDRHVLSNPGRILQRRVYQLAEELDMDRARIRGWAVAQAVLSAWWCVEDSGGGDADNDCSQSTIATAQQLAAIQV